MKALRFHDRLDLRIEQIEPPGSPGPHEVLVRNSFCGICGTDLHEYKSGPIFIAVEPHPLTHAKAPQILGHEYSGTVVAVGAQVTGVAPGDRVSIQPLVAPPDDFYSRRGFSQLAEGLALVGLSWAWGGMGEMSMLPEDNLSKLPDSVTDEQGAMIEPAAVVVHAVDRGRIAAGQSVLVTGAGPIGALACLAAAAAGATRIVVSDPNPARRRRVLQLGVVDEVVDPADPAALATIRRHSERGLGVDVALECVGHEAAFGTCLQAVRRRGTIVQVGLATSGCMVDLSALVTKDITLEGSWCYPTTIWPRVIGLVASGRLPVERVVTARIGLDEAVARGFDVLTEPGSSHLKILIATN